MTKLALLNTPYESWVTKFILASALSVSLVPAGALTLTTEDAYASTEYSTESAVSLSFTDDGITATTDGDGYKVEGTQLTINAAGTYIVSGTCSDGSIKIKKGTTGVTLVLDGLNLTSSDTAPIACNKSSEVTIIAAAGSTNTLTDSEQNNDDNYADNENAENAVIKCKDGSNVVIGGSGTLNIVANGKNGIKSGATTDDEGDASLTIEELTLNITASVNDAINAEQQLDVKSGTLTIAAADDAIHSDYVLNIGEEGSTSGPTIKVSECNEGLEGATLNVYAGDIDITASDDCLNAANSDLTDYNFTMNIAGGSIDAYSSEGDGFDSNGTLTISGGSVNVWTANTADNQPLDADGEISITGGTVLAAGGSNGMGTAISATQTYIEFGSTGSAGGNGQPGGMQPGDGTQPGGGMQPGGDGQGGDGQGGPGGNNQGSTTNDGQTSGSASTLSTTSDETASAMLSANQPGGGMGTTLVTSGENFTIEDASGNAVYTGTALCNAAYVLFSSPDLDENGSYTLNGNSSSTGTDTPGSGTDAPTPPDGSTEPPTPPDGSNPGGTDSGNNGSTDGSDQGNNGGNDNSGSTDGSDQGASASVAIDRLAGTNADDTAAAISQTTFPDGCDWVIIAREDDFADAMSATGLAGTLNAAIILTDRDGLSDAAREEIERLGATNAYIIGGNVAMPGNFESELAQMGVSAERVAGTNSWDTSVACADKIAEHGGNTTSSAIVAMSSNFQDALSMSSYAYKYGVPIYLETDDSNGRCLTDEAIENIADTTGTIYVAGGKVAVPTSTVEEVFGTRSVVRLAGYDGYDTSNQIATYMVEKGLLSAENATIACGAEVAKGVDALAGAALAGSKGGVILLVNGNSALEEENFTTTNGSDSENTAAFISTNKGSIQTVYALGGTTVMPESALAEIRAALA